MNYPGQCGILLVHVQIFLKCYVPQQTLFHCSSINISTSLLLNDIVMTLNLNCNLNVNRIIRHKYVNTSTMSRDSTKLCHWLQHFRLIFHHVGKLAIITWKSCSALQLACKNGTWNNSITYLYCTIAASMHVAVNVQQLSGVCLSVCLSVCC